MYATCMMATWRPVGRTWAAVAWGDVRLCYGRGATIGRGWIFQFPISGRSQFYPTVSCRGPGRDARGDPRATHRRTMTRMAPAASRAQQRHWYALRI